MKAFFLRLALRISAATASDDDADGVAAVATTLNPAVVVIAAIGETASRRRAAGTSPEDHFSLAAMSQRTSAIIDGIKKKKKPPYSGDDDDCGGDDEWVTLIHGDWYDLRPFVKSHPGGPIAIRTAAQLDATLLLHSQHPFTDARTLGVILEPLLVSDDEQARLDAKFPAVVSPPPALDGHEFDLRAAEASLGIPTRRRRRGGPSSSSTPPPAVDPFEAELKAEVRAYFESLAAKRGISLLEATKAPPEQWLVFALNAAVLLVFGLIPLLRTGSVASMIFAPLSLMTLLGGLWHDGGHFAVSRNWRISAAFASSVPWVTFADEWYSEHTVWHHTWTNVPGKDPDLLPESRLRYRPAARRQSQRDAGGLADDNSLHPIEIWALHASLLIYPVLSVRSAWDGVLLRVVPFKKLRGLAFCRYAAARLGFTVATLGWPWLLLRNESHARRAACSVVPWIVISFYFVYGNFVTHLTEETTSGRDRSWYRHQVKTTSNFASSMATSPLWVRLMTWFTGGINTQIEHHLFPTVAHWHLPMIQPIVERLCHKHGMPYKNAPSLPAARKLMWLNLVPSMSQVRLKVK